MTMKSPSTNLGDTSLQATQPYPSWSLCASREKENSQPKLTKLTTTATAPLPTEGGPAQLPQVTAMASSRGVPFSLAFPSSLPGGSQFFPNLKNNQSARPSLGPLKEVIRCLTPKAAKASSDLAKVPCQLRHQSPTQLRDASSGQWQG